MFIIAFYQSTLYRRFLLASPTLDWLTFWGERFVHLDAEDKYLLKTGETPELKISNIIKSLID